MDDNIENRQPTSPSTSSGAFCGEASGLQGLLKKDKQPLFKDDKMGEKKCFGATTTCREVFCPFQSL